MSSSRDYRSDPPSHQRLAARQAAQKRNRSPEYMTDPRNYPHPSSQYGSEDYSQSRRVFTSDRDHREDNRRSYDDMHYYSPQREGRRSPNYYNQHYSQPSNVGPGYGRRDDRRHSPSPNHSQSFRVPQEDKWHDDYRNRRSPFKSSALPPDLQRPGPSSYQSEKYSPPHEKRRVFISLPGRDRRPHF